MNFPFDAKRGAIVVLASISGPSGSADLRLVLDTGATNCLIRKAILESIGYDPDASTDRVRVAMGNGVEVVPQVVVNRLSALDSHRIGFRVLARTSSRSWH